MEAVRLRRTGSFAVIRPGGQRQPLQYDPKGYFVITVDREEEQIVLQHYRPDHTPAHEMQGRVAESMVLGLVREDLVSQLSHAGYIGAELAKARKQRCISVYGTSKIVPSRARPGRPKSRKTVWKARVRRHRNLGFRRP